MTWNSAERGPNDHAMSQDFSAHDTHNDRADLSASLWKPGTGCGGGGCSCGNCCRGERSVSNVGSSDIHGKVGGAIGKADDWRGSTDRFDPGVHEGWNFSRANEDIGRGIDSDFRVDSNNAHKRLHQVSRVLEGLGIELNIPTLWPKLDVPDQRERQSEGADKNRTITVSNGDQLTLGGMHGFELKSKDGEPIEIVGSNKPMATDMPVEHVLSNGAIYRSRGGFNHDESITWPNGDVVRFSDSGKFESYESNNEQTSDDNGGNADSVPGNHDGADSGKDSYVFNNGDRFVSTNHGWELYTADGERVTKGTADPNSPMDATRIPLSNGAILVSGGWGVDTIRYPDGETISFSKNGDLR